MDLPPGAWCSKIPYLLPLLGPARRPRLLAIPLAVGVGVSALWQTGQAHLFVCDTRFFGAKLDPALQRHEVLRHRPAASRRRGVPPVVDHGGQVEPEPITVGGRVVDSSILVAVLVLVGFLALAVQLDPTQRFGSIWQQRTSAPVFVAMYFAGARRVDRLLRGPAGPHRPAAPRPVVPPRPRTRAPRVRAPAAETRSGSRSGRRPISSCSCRSRSSGWPLAMQMR